MNSLNGLTVTEVAEMLGITRASVHDLLRSGQLITSGRTAHSLVIDRSSVERLTATGTRRGRAWTARIAWAALAILSGQNPTWISASEKSRLKKRLSTLDAHAVSILARNKDRTFRYRATPDALLALSDYLIASGATAMRDETTAETFGMTGGSGIAEGYVMAGDARALANSFGLAEDPEGNAVIHEVELEEPFAEGRAPIAAVAVDLMRSLAIRERSAGQRVIEELLHV
ncbi:MULTISPECIES: helix-turn-helix domain-containing protein [Paenarthrobacter]|uniref:helix-turn-helix domain-containing protein n=1 Tax=Paenarthrobacter TaxID=1742992 RepID=UPI001FB2A3A1|nr:MULTISPECIES: helix-turn-helix domain-containing protein [Paenarthrobacter]MCW3767788.1 helix-turn-helix domain-containing protein [Paenarthrobacter sp. PAE-2]UOD83402.1 helix-turn-helix domain-containing protein [Paenarthrobacter ureafaciens]WNZ05110.1 helix-turn-helix domain-containing protein [Paenarthrobacter ureafaciens]WOC63274.1 helix-turn-helix domain-containing protein [Paenarthrobacter sp. AT5]